MATHTDPPKTPDTKPGAKPVAKDDLQKLPIAEVEKRLSSSPDGLSEAEAKKRLTQYGPNEIAEKKTNALLKFLGYFWGPIPWMIEVAVVLSAIVRHWPDFFIILVLLLANATIGFWEEREAGNAIDALKARLAIKARVKRDGKWVTPPAKDLVPGDAIRLRLGDIVPADARLLDGDEISVDQSALTGESLPITRKSGDAVFSGSIIRRGEIDALVYATGGKTYFGRTAELVETAVTVSHFQKAVLKIGDFLIVLALIMVAVIVALSIYRGEAILSTLQFALVLTVAAIPVAMPTVLSVTMAVGARKLAKKQAIVSKLVAIEELAGVDVLCADKTGTLTQNKLTLGAPFCLDKITPDDLILAGALASRQENDDTIDLAVLGGLKDKGALKPYQGHAFHAVRSRAQAHRGDGEGRGRQDLQGDQGRAAGHPGPVRRTRRPSKDAVDKAVNDFAARGFRALGVARAEDDGKWRLLGVLPLFDPPRVDAKETIATAAKMGVKIKMVTGDALAIAREMAKTLGMGANILDGGATRRFQDRGNGGGRQGDRGRRRLRPGLPRAQVPHRRRHAEARPHRRHDGRRRQRRARAEEGRLRLRGLRRDRRGARGRLHRAGGAGARRDHRRDQGEPRDLPADEQLRDLPHRGDVARAAVHDAGDRRLQLLSRHRDHDRDARPAQRRRDPVDRLRQCPLSEPARSLGHADGSDDRHRARGSSARSPPSGCSTWATRSSTSTARSSRP